MANIEIKKWHQRWWGILFLIIVALVIVIFLFYFYQTLYFVDNIKKRNFSVFSPEVLGPAYYQMQKLPSPTMAEIATADDPFVGPATAKVVVVQFFNYHCPYSQQAFAPLSRIINEYQDRVKFVFRDYPVEYVYPGSTITAEAGECADDQGKFLEYSALIYKNQDNLAKENLKKLAQEAGLNMDNFNRCLDYDKYKEDVSLDLAAGAVLGVSGTPTYFISGVKIPGVITYESFKNVLDEQLALVK